MTPSKIVFYFCLSFIAGIAIASVFGIHFSSSSPIKPVFIAGIVTLSFLIIIILLFSSLKRDFIIFGFCLLFLTLGVIFFQKAELSAKNDSLRQLNESNKKVTIEGVINEEPDVRENYQSFKVKVNGIKSIILVSSDLRSQYSYLDEVKLTGKLENPQNFDNFNYQEYLLKDKIYSVIAFPKIEIIKTEKQYTIASYFYEKILFFKNLLHESINKNFYRPEKDILEGIILGKNAVSDKDLKEKLNATGLTHLISVSGSNVVVLADILITLFLLLGLWRGQAFYLALEGLWMYVMITGLPSSAVRAAIMASIFLFAEKMGRQNTSSRAIIIAGSLMLLENPFLLRYDIGFQLSFLASLGIIHIKPLISQPLKEFFKKYITKKILIEKMGYFIDILSITLAAQIVTLPIVAYNFKNISLVSPMTNLLIIPIVDVLLMLGIFSACLGIFWQFLGWVFALPCWFLLAYFIKIITLFSQPWSMITVPEFSWLHIAIYYAALCMLVVYITKKLKPTFL